MYGFTSLIISLVLVAICAFVDYRYEKGMIHIQVEMTLGKYQEPLLNLEKKLESGLYCELVSKELHDSYVDCWRNR